MSHILINGRLVREDEPVIRANDRGFMLADGLFETLLYQPGHLCHFQAHVDRLLAGISALSLPLLFSVDTLHQACMQLIEANKLESCTAAIRVTYTRGPAGRGLSQPAQVHPTLLIQAWSYTPSAGGVCLTQSPISHPGKTHLSSYKTLQYTANVTALNEAMQRGFDDALLCHHDRVVCSTKANIFACVDNVITTPAIEEGALPGVIRGCVIALLKKHNLDYRLGALTIEKLNRATHVWLTNSLVGLQVVTSIDGVHYADRLPDLLLAEQLVHF